MIFRTPPLRTPERRALEQVERLQVELASRVRIPRRWHGSLRRLSLARAVQGSNSIEGYHARLDDVAAAVQGDEALDADTETLHALEGYRDAMTYVLQLGQDDDVVIEESLLRSLHFIMMRHDLGKNPGRWRPGAIWVRRESDGRTVYEGPPAAEVPGLIGQLVDSLRGDDDPVIVRAAMAHLDLVMIHPFRDGNGRMARCLQTLVLARGKIVVPVFSSIEEYLGANTAAYYEVLAAVGGGRWSPSRDARPWVRFCLTAHYRQARTVLRRVDEAERLWDACTVLAVDRGVPLRAVGVLSDAARGFRIRNATYRTTVRAAEGEEITDQTASRDLKALVDAGLLDPVGEKRARVYLAAEPVRGAWMEIRSRRPPGGGDDPFAADFVALGDS